MKVKLPMHSADIKIALAPLEMGLHAGYFPVHAFTLRPSGPCSGLHLAVQGMQQQIDRDAECHDFAAHVQP
ncbi:hypothetical protein D9M69_595680 [compost metagenome]